jgi:hypothetical protein
MLIVSVVIIAVTIFVAEPLRCSDLPWAAGVILLADPAIQ